MTRNHLERTWPPKVGVRLKLEHRGISQVTYQPKSVGKMADLETLTFCISLNSSQIYTHFCKDLATGYCLHLGKISILNFPPFSN